LYVAPKSPKGGLKNAKRPITNKKIAHGLLAGTDRDDLELP